MCPVVQEAVQFCVTVCEFGVANSVSGVRKMLPLVWSTDAAIKDAVVQAYRRLYLNPQGDTIRSVWHTCQTLPVHLFFFFFLLPKSAFSLVGFGLDDLTVNLKPDWQSCFSLSFIRMKAQTLVDSLSELMVDASLGTVQCLEEIVSDSFLLLHHCLLILYEGE